MPYLFCEQHGREHEARCEEEQGSYRWLGETVLIISGPLKSPSWRCDECHVRMRRGSQAWLVAAFAGPNPQQFDEYAHAAAREYFLIEHADARAYGAACLSGVPSPTPLIPA
jgi:hypothetical protein